MGPFTHEKTLHHELSSTFKAGMTFLASKWRAVNKPDFRYLPTQMELIRPKILQNRQAPIKAPEWYAAGFVSDYGMSSLENDFNTYAELAMTEPEKLKQLADQYHRIRFKTRILTQL